MNFSSDLSYSYIPQYALLFFLLFRVVRSSKGLCLQAYITLVILLFFSTLSFGLGKYFDYSVNYKGVLASFLVVIFYYGYQSISIRFILRISLGILMLEYFIAYFILQEFHLIRYFFGLPLIRPMGVFADIHLTACFFVLAFFVILRRHFMSGVFGLLFMNLQALLMWFIMACASLSRRILSSVFLIMIAGGVLFLILVKTGYLVEEGHYSLWQLFERLSMFDFGDLNSACLVFGCSTNWQQASEVANFAPDGHSILDDIGYINILYQFGLFWALIFIYKIYKLNKIVATAVLFSSFHYAVFFGFLGIALSISIAKEAFLSKPKKPDRSALPLSRTAVLRPGR